MVALMIAGDNSDTEMDADSRQQPVANECADNTYKEIADDSETGPAHDFAGQPAGNKTDHQYDQKTFIRHVHDRTSKALADPLVAQNRPVRQLPAIRALKCLRELNYRPAREWRKR